MRELQEFICTQIRIDHAAAGEPSFKELTATPAVQSRHVAGRRDHLFLVTDDIASDAFLDELWDRSPAHRDDGASRRRWKFTTHQRAGARRAPDLVRRHFNAAAANVLWVADATCIPTGEGFLYLAVVLNVFSRRIVGWAMSNHLYTELMLRALNMALLQRRAEGAIHHSDQGAQGGFNRSSQH
jgi:hypothetical protein